MIDVKPTIHRMREFLRDPRAFAVAMAGGAAVVTNLLIGIAWAWQADVARTEHIDAFGTTTAAQLATLSVEPLISLDAIRLGVLTTRLSGLPAVRLAAVHTLDDRVVALAGDESLAQAHVFTAPIEFEDETAGYARIVIDDQAITGGLSFGPVVALMALVTIALCAVLAYVLQGSMFPIGLNDDPAEESPAAATQRTFLLVVNLFNLNRVAGPDRPALLHACRSRLENIARLGGARVMELPGTGWLLVFTASADPDHAFRVVLHALLAAEVLDEINEADDATGRLELIFRFGLHDLVPPETDPELRRSDELADAIVLSAVAPDGCVAASESAFERILRPERLIADELVNPVLSSLATARTDACVVISTTADTYRHALDRALEAFHQSPSESPSTF
jgi:uncharacterized membrane protein affecting hemolysin expression